ncbi:MAG: hypothetical protein CMF50_02210 [Legionellales bacterium]|nr:hypothetical protein [Legionellales bacterium]|tara:strand:+ start:36688 stop:37440 length:753 start_codon:yes stop_codon:yes gene_type:complete
MNTTTHTITMQPRFLWFLMLCYTMAMVLANWFDPRLIHIFGLNTDAGALIFPLTFLFADLITEIYGYKHTRRAIWCGFLFNILFLIYGQIVIHLPSPSYATHNEIFNDLMTMDGRIILGSIVSYFLAEPLNAIILAKLKIKMQGKAVGSRYVLSTFIAAGFDSVFFSTIAFYGMMSNNNLVEFIITLWFIKVAVEILGLPISLPLTKKLKRLEGLDIYDKHTKFNFLSLEGDYSSEDNLLEGEANSPSSD